ncbi:dissimilatory sulfite reductase (desulfoviridin) alpha/beta subunit [Alkalibaculum bacchi]|uniref:Dissimilatory sulfite reductase (Desulfoviridin) alpha/beta subunit n=1 Tax=Alkalibaculum bacchi TaxID=645887 RepID=A0A366I5P6_9FIRM|nr:4Fe-4S binding protein [Alkalibaculum bacchi]RBP63811.1 dissimilatory sulfite reductase (desulfoviridin) alpha/beta subunit [Alkalibaculum bacchi]
MASLKVTLEEEKRVKGLGFLRNRGTDNFSARVITVNGKLTPQQARCIAEAAEKFGDGNILFTTRLSVECPGIPYDKIEDFRAFIAKEGLQIGGTGPKVRPIVACKGSTCNYGLIDVSSLSEEMHRRFYEGYREVKLPHKFKIAVGGCPNNCVKPDLNDVGVMGSKEPNLNKELCKSCKKCAVVEVCPTNAAQVVDGIVHIDYNTCIRCGRCVSKCHFDALRDSQVGYKICVGGTWGKNVNRGKALNRVFKEQDEVLDTIEKVILFYKDQGIAGERLANTIDRLGFESFEEEMLKAPAL